MRWSSTWRRSSRGVARSTRPASTSWSTVRVRVVRSTAVYSASSDMVQRLEAVITPSARCRERLRPERLQLPFQPGFAMPADDGEQVEDVAGQVAGELARLDPCHALLLDRTPSEPRDEGSTIAIVRDSTRCVQRRTLLHYMHCTFILTARQQQS